MHILGIKVGEDLFDLILDSRRFQQIAIGICRDGKTMGNGDTLGGKMLIHLTEGGILAAHQRNVVNADIVKP